MGSILLFMVAYFFGHEWDPSLMERMKVVKALAKLSYFYLTKANATINPYNSS